MTGSLLSVIMLVYNAEDYLNESIVSILDQDFKDFEFIIIDDGSTDNSLNIIKSFDDDRIKLSRNEINHGIVYSRNKGIRLSSGKYIGMMDADDIALPHKFSKQIEFLESNGDFGMVGSWARLIDQNGHTLRNKWKLTGSSEYIPSIMLFKNYFIQSAVVFRRDCLPDYLYKEGYEIVEDYKLWLDIINKSKAWNLQEYLIKYRIHDHNITQTKKTVVKQNLRSVYLQMFNDLGIVPTDVEIEIHHMIREGMIICDTQTFLTAKTWLEKLLYQNSKKNTYDRKAFAGVLLNRWLKLIWISRKMNPLNFFIFFNSNILKEYLISRIQKPHVR